MPDQFVTRTIEIIKDSILIRNILIKIDRVFISMYSFYEPIIITTLIGTEQHEFSTLGRGSLYNRCHQFLVMFFRSSSPIFGTPLFKPLPNLASLSLKY